MNFNQFHYWPGLLLIFAVFFIVVVMMERRFFKFVKTYWFYNRSIFSYLSTLLFLAGIGGLILSLLDIRGPEEKIKMQVPSDRTIILIDTSASMLAEDVKPSRLQKASLIAKHFARKAAGHQLSIVAFAEVQKKIVPFTNDIDLIDARLDSLENLRNQYGSSALTSALQESIQYFKETGGDESGNILVFTDGEETAEGIDLKVPKSIHVAFVGIGTEQGGRIPLDDGRGFRFGYKKDKGRDVITKLNENFFRKVTADVPSSKYWLANSYSLPSEEILEFFKSEKTKGNDQQDMVIKPVLMEWIVVPALLLIFLSYFFKALRIFSLGLLLIITPVNAQNEQQEPQFSPEAIERMSQLQRGELNQLEKIKLADDLLKAGAKDEAIALYQENLPFPIDKSIPSEAYLNYGTVLIEKGEEKKGFEIYQKLKESGIDEKTTEIMDKNVVNYFKQEEKKKQEEKQKEKDKKENKDQQDKNDQNQDQNQSGNDQQKNQQNQSGQQQNKQDKNQQGGDQKKEEKKDKGENKDEKKEDENKDQSKDEENKPQEGQEGEEKKQLPPKKIPAKLKQLMSDDRQLQMKMIEQGTRDLNKRKSRKSKDW